MTLLQLPTVSTESVDGFLSPFNTSLDDKAKQLYEGRFLLYIRAATERDTTFFLASCAAEMKKSVHYEVDVVIDKDGAISECQCECAVGTGPDAHCKHVRCLLFALSSTTASDIVTRETCTQRLQTFHHCRAFKGSPQKASLLQLRQASGKRELSQYSDFDPRPPKRQRVDTYQATVNNLCVNYQATHGCKSTLQSMPILQRIPPANIYAVANDHDYLPQHPEQIFLERFGISNVSQAMAESIEQATQGQTTKKLWFAERSKRMCSSSFGKLCKCTDRTNKPKLATSLLSATCVDAAPLRHGRKYEAVAVKKYEEMTGSKTTPCGIFVSLTHPFLSSSPDRLLDDDKTVEVKCPYTSREQFISPLTVPYLQEVGGELYLDTRHDYYYQVQGQLFCSGRQHCDFVVYTMKDVKIIQISRDDKFIDNMVDSLNQFYESFFRQCVLDKYFYKNCDKYTFQY